MNPAARGANDELVNLALIGLVAAFALALVLRAAATAAAVATGAATPDRRDRERPACPHRSGPAGASVRRPRVVSARLLERGDAVHRRPRGTRLVRVETGRSPPAPDCSRSSPHPGHRNRTGHRRDGIEEGPRTTRRAPSAPRSSHPRRERRRLPARAQPWPRDLGIGRGLDPRDRPAAIRQGPAPRHQRDPRRTRRRRHHLHAARQHRRHASTPARSAGRSPSSTHSTSPRDCPPSAAAASAGHRSAAVRSR